jgi:hypothetical protein
MQGQDQQQQLYAQQQQLAAQQAALMQQQQHLAQQAQQLQPQLFRQNSLGYPAYSAQQYPVGGYQQQQQLGPGGQPAFVPAQPSYSASAYSSTPQAGPQSYGVNNAMHSQVYVPEGGSKTSKPATAGPGQAGATGKIEAKLDNADKGINRFLKKLEKKSIF